MEFLTLHGTIGLPRDAFELSRGTYKTLILSLVQNKMPFKFSLDVKVSNLNFGPGSSPVTEIKRLLLHGLPEDVGVIVYKHFKLSPSGDIAATVSYAPMPKRD